MGVRIVSMTQENSPKDKSETPKKPAKRPKRGCAWIFMSVILVVGAIWGAALGAFVWVVEDAKRQIPMLDTFRPKIGSRVYSADGKLMAEFTRESRQLVHLSEVPLHLVKAFIAVEDDTFYEHKGVRPLAVASAVRDSLMGKDVRGASTITQQVVRNIEMTGVTKEKTIQRKINEAIMALQFERQFTKDEILEMYLNQIFLGISAWGIESAANQYFGKSCRDLTLGESALIAGLTSSPNRYNPLRHPDRAIERRRIVLKLMLRNKFITQEQHDAALAESLDDAVMTPEKRKAMAESGKGAWGPGLTVAPYFVEDLRKKLLAEVGADELFEGGLEIHTTIDTRLQKAAEESLREALDDFDKNKLESLKKAGREREFIPVSGALVCLDNRPGFEGYIRAMVGGRDFKKEQFNTATQALRQPGSSVKPFVWAAALDQKMTPSHQVFDAPFARIDGAGNIWRPQNFMNRFTFQGVTLRRALERSVNVVSIKLVEQIGMPVVRSYLRDSGITTPIDNAVGLTIGLGTPEVRVIDLCTAFATIANRGVRFEPAMITEINDRDGFTRYEHLPKQTRAIPEDVAYALTYLLRGVASEWGSGRATRDLDPWQRAGKTGTTNENRNAWFSGFTANYTCVVWVGYRDNRSLGKGISYTGGRIGCPLWTSFMVKAHEGMPIRDFDPPPYGVKFYSVDRETGLADKGDFQEVFIRGTKPPTEPPVFDLDNETEVLMALDTVVGFYGG